MPHILVKTTKELSKDQRDSIASQLGELISIIPGKSERVLMLDFSTSSAMYFKGAEINNCAYIDIKLHGQTEFAHKAELTKAIFTLLNEELGINNSEAYITVQELNSWGVQGELK